MPYFYFLFYYSFIRMGELSLKTGFWYLNKPKPDNKKRITFINNAHEYIHKSIHCATVTLLTTIGVVTSLRMESLFLFSNMVFDAGFVSSSIFFFVFLLSFFLFVSMVFVCLCGFLLASYYAPYRTSCRVYAVYFRSYNNKKIKKNVFK